MSEFKSSVFKSSVFCRAALATTVGRMFKTRWITTTPGSVGTNGRVSRSRGRHDENFVVDKKSRNGTKKIGCKGTDVKREGTDRKKEGCAVTDEKREGTVQTLATKNSDW